MRNTFKLSGQNSLKMNQVPVHKEINLLNTFKAGSDLRGQLNKSKIPTKTSKLNKNTQSLLREQLKSEDQALQQEVAALDHFKAPVTHQKTKNMIENIKLRRREKHINALSRFHEDLDDYKENVFTIYSQLTNDIEQVMSIKLGSITEYLNSCDNDQYLLSKQKPFVEEINSQISSYKSECELKLNQSKEQIERIKNGRGSVVTDTCEDLCGALTEIAFVLEGEAKEISEKQKDQIQKLEERYYEEYAKKITDQIQEQTERNKKVEERGEEIIKKWRETKENYQLKFYEEDVQSDQYRRPQNLRKLFDRLIEIQMSNHNLKVKLMQNLIQEDPDTYSKVNIGKFNQQMKKINDRFDENLDQILNEFIQAKTTNKNNNQERLQHCLSRLTYIENHTSEEIEEIMKQKCNGLCERNINEQEDLIKNATSYVQTHDDKQNKVMTAFSLLVGKIGDENDTFIKDFNKLNTEYEVQKAKILDEDEELVEKLNEELNKLKVDLREALHHIKLEEVQKQCFQKVDEIERAYRQTHDNNKKLKQTRTPSLEQFMKKYEAKLAQIMQLFDPSRKNQLEEKNKQEAEEEAMRRIEAEDKKKAEEQARLIEEAKQKGGKPPPAAKPKDPKKLAAEQQERKKAILAEMGPKSIEEIQTDTGSHWLVFRTIEEICKGFYNFKEQKQKEENNQGEKQEQKPADQNVNQQEQKKAVDQPEDEYKDCRGMPVVTDKAYMRLTNLVPQITTLRQKLFDSVGHKKKRVLDESQELDEQMLDESLTNLDQRLKSHYSLKGTIQSQIYVKRSGQITNHKKKYEKYARTIKDKMDLQTEKFNFLLEKGLEKLKEHNAEQKKMREFIPKCKNLSELQGMFSRTRENFNSFGLTIKEIYSELERLSGYQIDVLLEKNQGFIKESKLMKEGGEYSEEEIAWYQEMLGEITKQMTEQQEKRKEKLQELRNHSEKRRKQLLDAFEKDYIVAIEESAAKDGTGKKYGRPKRIAQEKTRLEMNKCEQAQINIDKMISDLGKEYQSFMTKGFEFQEEPPTLQWRNKLMTIQTCIMRYGKHIEAFLGELKIQAMERVNYDQNSSSCKLAAEDEEKDKARKDKELQALGKLYEQKDDRVFMKYIEEIEKIISDESRTIYVGDKAKYITGNDKIPDFLRTYIANMKSNSEGFRISSIRQLRESCKKLADLSACMSELFFTSILNFTKNNQNKISSEVTEDVRNFIEKHKKSKNEHMKKLRPNLLNPKCQEELKNLDEQEGKRKQQYLQISKELECKFKDEIFKNANVFLNKIFNNFQFLINLTNSFYLNEDFVKCPGDQIEEKNHLDIQRLMLMKQKGIKIDPSSQRNLKRKWQGIDFTVFNIENRKYEYKKVVAEEPKEKDKKGGKKDSKDPKKQQQVIEGDPNKSKTIETFKTWRQKSVFEKRNQAYERLHEEFKQIVERIMKQIENDKKQDENFSKKWRQTADSLYIK